MSSFLQSCVERYQELVPKEVNLRRVDTPYLEDTETVETEEPRGELQPIASRILMKILYAARMCRFDLLRPCCFLATRITKWGTCSDEALHRLVCYINSTLEVKMHAWVGNPPSEWEFVVYSDADFASDKTTSRSTTGVLSCIKASSHVLSIERGE
jgi:hypothetical protein